MRIGFGFDVHRLVPGRPLILAGITLDHDYGLLGHSDADVVVHAVEDAILGALALGDIGKLFPDTDPCYKDASSMEMLKTVISLMEKEGYSIGNVDITLAAEAPKIAPYIEDMRASLAAGLHTKVKNVSIKATTTEEMGYEGRREGMSCYAVCLLKASKEVEG
ncbi:MAG: 2-C-methyl-D-erythritol 2,4-cyclodiphosphate synthase [Tissierellia bacterium]|nr:2-C-methyl-D-erythritol 2,4-cyclodiphosphate synthase [Tissierellia bacterium]